MKTKISTKELMNLCQHLVDEEFQTWEEIYPNGYEKDDLTQELLCAYYQKVFPRLDELDAIAAENGHKLITYVRQKLSTILFDIHRHYRALYKRILNMTLKTVDWIEETEEDANDLNTVKKYYRPFMAQQPKRADVVVSESDDISDFTSDLSDRDKKILDMYLAKCTEREIAEEIGISQPAVHKRVVALQKKANEEIH